jgi:hypothetical protein
MNHSPLALSETGQASFGHLAGDLVQGIIVTEGAF